MTPLYFTEKVKDNFPTVYEHYCDHFRLTVFDSDSKVKLDGQSLSYLIIGDMDYQTFTDTIGATETLNDDAYISFNRRTEIELDFFYKYIQDNIDLIYFRLL